MFKASTNRHSFPARDCCQRRLAIRLFSNQSRACRFSGQPVGHSLRCCLFHVPHSTSARTFAGDVGVNGEFSAFWYLECADEEVIQARRHPEDDRRNGSFTGRCVDGRTLSRCPRQRRPLGSGCPHTLGIQFEQDQSVVKTGKCGLWPKLCVSHDSFPVDFPDWIHCDGGQCGGPSSSTGAILRRTTTLSHGSIWIADHSRDP